MTDRAAVCRSAAAALRDNAGHVASLRCLVGFDGFVDAICDVVETRRGAADYDAVPTIARLGDKITAAAGVSSNLEVVVKTQKLGGNGPIFANALARFGFGVSYVGNLGYPEVHPVFADFAKVADVRTVAEPGYTDALEFGDGKLMLGKHDSLGEVNWQNLLSRVGETALLDLISGATMLGMVNWTMLAGMSQIWAKLVGDVLPELASWNDGTGRRQIFIDLADPEKRTRDDLRYAVRLVARMQPFADVTLGLNLREAEQVAEVLGLPEKSPIDRHARGIRDALDVSCVVVHPRGGAAAATASDAAVFDGPFVQHPKISTGAGDHFNAGFMLGRILGLPLEECLCIGVATSGHYVRTGDSPTLTNLADFVANLPGPEAE